MGHEQVVVFTLAGEAYGLPIRTVQEIIRYAPPRTIPQPGFAVLGVINLRSKIIPVCDVRVLLDLPGPSLDAAKASIVILETVDGALGLVVDEVDQVTTIDTDDVDTTTSTSRAMAGIVRSGDRLVVVLDVAHLAAAFAGTALDAPGGDALPLVA
jgi:purine-binding chemotaxis protein CheW